MDESVDVIFRNRFRNSFGALDVHILKFEVSTLSVSSYADMQLSWFSLSWIIPPDEVIDDI